MVNFGIFHDQNKGIALGSDRSFAFQDDDTINVADLFPYRYSILCKYYYGNNTSGNQEWMKDNLEICLVLGVELLFLMWERRLLLAAER